MNPNSFDEATGRDRGLRAQQVVTLPDADSPGLLVKPEVARKQMEAVGAQLPGGQTPAGKEDAQPGPGHEPSVTPTRPPTAAPVQPKRFYGTVTLDATRVGRDASRIADEVLCHLTGLVGSNVEVVLEIQANVPDGISDHVVRTVTENCRTLKFTSQGFEAS